MKYMKLGSKADAFQTLGNIRCVASEVASDFAILVDGVIFHLHKFPLLSKSAKLQRMVEEAREFDNGAMVEIPNFPGGSETFEVCAKFCYGISITLNAFNAVSVRCASEYLEMTEALEKGNLIFKMDIFLRSCIFQAWKDAIIALKTTTMFLPLSEDINLVSHCIDALATKASVHPSQVNWPFTNTRGGVKGKKSKEIKAHHHEISPCKNGMERISKHDMVPKDWWIEDLAELEIDLYSGVMVVIKSIGKAPNSVVGEALNFYAVKWLPNQILTKVPSIDNMEFNARNHLLILEKVITLLPSERGSTSCSFLLRLLKLANTLGASSSLKLELARMVGSQLEEASVDELMIPSSSNLYDIDLVLSIVMEHFMMQEEVDQSPLTSTTLGLQYHAYEKERSQSREMIDFMDNKKDHSSKLVAKLIDGYLVEISQDPQLDVPKFIALAKSVPDFARPLHDGLYKAIDVYLKGRPGLSKAERKKVCSLLDCKRLSMEACIHATQNEDLPLRVVMQVLFFEQVRRVMSGGIGLPTSVQALIPSQKGTTQITSTHEGDSNGQEDGKKETFYQKLRAIKYDLANLKKRVAKVEKERETTKVSKPKGILNVPSKPTFFLCKLWPINKVSTSVKSCTISPTISP